MRASTVHSTFLILALAAAFAAPKTSAEEGAVEPSPHPAEQASGIPAPASQESALSLDAGGNLYLGAFQWKPGSISDAVLVGFHYEGEYFDALAKFGALNDGAYDTSSTYGLDHYLIIQEAKVRLALGGFTFSGGKGGSADIADSPYSIFISSNPISSVFMDISWESSIFSYHSRWIRLNEDSALVYEGTQGGMPVLDRGMNFKTYTLNLGPLRIGFEDCVVYLCKSFDAEYFLSPAPMFIAELVSTSPGRPDRVEGNTNSLMGFFADYRMPEWDVYGQFLIDDINSAPILGWAIPSLNDYHNLNKFAWSAGGRWRSPWGAFSFHHGGATAYTFESTFTATSYPSGILSEGLDVVPAYNILPYEYVYYPVTEYDMGNGTWNPIPYVDNYIGYKYGENNIAFQFGYANEALADSAWPFGYSACLEYVVSGTKAPSNPWAESDTWVGITDAYYRLLDEDVLEHRLVFSAAAAKTWRGWSFSLAGELGYVWNKLALVETNAGEAKIWKPQDGVGSPVYSLALGASYRWNIRERAAGRDDAKKK